MLIVMVIANLNAFLVCSGRLGRVSVNLLGVFFHLLRHSFAFVSSAIVVREIAISLF